MYSVKKKTEMFSAALVLVVAEKTRTFQIGFEKRLTGIFQIWFDDRFTKKTCIFQIGCENDYALIKNVSVLNSICAHQRPRNLAFGLCNTNTPLKKLMWYLFWVRIRKAFWSMFKNRKTNIKIHEVWFSPYGFRSAEF